MAKFTFPHASGSRTLDTYGNVISGNIIDDSVSIIFIKKFILSDT